MINFSQTFAERLRTYGVSVEYEVESLKSAIDLLSGITELIPDVDLSTLGQDFDALEWFLLLLKKPEEALTSGSEAIAWAMSYLDEPSKVLIFAKLEAYFKSQFTLWNWESIKANAIANYNNGGEYKWGRDFLGTTYAILPSGRFYAPWGVANEHDVEGAIDVCWLKALESAADACGLTIDTCEGYSPDIYAVICIEE